MSRLLGSILRILVHIAALLPLIILLWDFTMGMLSANPIEDIIIRTGRAALIMLMLSLACTPIHTLSGFRQVLRLRRTLGLYAVMYAGLHFLVFVGLDYGFNFPLIWKDLADKPFVLLGFSALLLLLPLAITSTQGWRKRLSKNWEHLHGLIYIAATLVIAHFVFQAKVDAREPQLYGAIVIILLVLRLPGLSNIMVRLRNRQKDKVSTPQEPA